MREAVAELGGLCARKSARLIHISTDYVFDGEKRTPYSEEDDARPISVYGGVEARGGGCASRGAGRSICRCGSRGSSGPDRPSFVDQILQRALETDQLAAIDDKIAVPTYTLDLAKWLRPLLAADPVGGLMHLCNAGACTWREYGEYALACAASVGAPLRGQKVAPQKMADVKAFIAKRPVYTVMNTQKFTSFTGETPRTWQAAVEEYVGHWCEAWRTA